MPADTGTPDLVRHCVAAVAKQYGGDTSKAFAICVAQLQKAGYLKPGTMELTAAGKQKEKEHEAEPDAAKKMKAYEKLLKANRKEEAVEADRGSVTAQESSTDFMRRLAGIATRYADRVVETSNYKTTTSRQSGMFSGNTEKIGSPQDEQWATSRVQKMETPTPGIFEPLRVWTLWKRGDGKAVKADTTTEREEAEQWGAAGKQKGKKQEANRKEESDYSDFDRLMNPTSRTGLEEMPMGAQRRWENRTTETPMDMMKRLAGISTRFTDRTTAAPAVAEAADMGAIGRKMKGHVTNLQNEIADLKQRLSDMQDAWQERDWEWLASAGYITAAELKDIQKSLD